MPVGTSTGLFFEDESDYQLHLMGATNDEVEKPAVKEEPFTPLTDDEHKTLMWDTPVVSSKDPNMTPSDVQDMLDQTDEDRQKQYDESVKTFGEKNVLGGVQPSGRIRGWKSIPAFQEFMKNMPKDVDVHDMKDGTIIFRKKPGPKPPLTS